MIFFGWFHLALAVLHFDTGAAFKAPNGSYVSDVKRLYDYLMEDYSSFIRPVKNKTQPVIVVLELNSYKVDDLDEKNQAFMLSANLAQSWRDAGFVWNAEDFNGLTFIDMPYTDIWHPDVVIDNSRNAHYIPPTHHTALVTEPSRVFWNTHVNIETHCELDLSEFPFDEHVCKIVFLVWNEYDSAIKLIAPADAPPTLNDSINDNLEWQLVKVTVERNEKTFHTFKDIYSDVTFRFTIRRRTTFATHLFVEPSVMLCLVTPVVFLLPPGSGEKMVFGIGVLIADTLLLGELINYIPTAHPHLPLIAKYFVGNIVMASLSLAISAIIVGFWDKSTSRLSGPPAFFRLIFLGPVATVLCVRKDDLFSADVSSSGGGLEMNPQGEDGTESTSGIIDPEIDIKRRFKANAARSEWRQLAVVFDRLFFVIYCVILAILTLSFARYI